MNDIYIPIELEIIGASLWYGKDKITGKEIAEYEKRISYRLEISTEEKWEYVKYDEEKDEYTIDLKGKKLHPQIIAILTNI